MGVLSCYYHLFNQNFTDQRNISTYGNRLTQNTNAAYDNYNMVKGAKGGLAATSKRCKGAVAVPNCVLKIQRGE